MRLPVRYRWELFVAYASLSGLALILFLAARG